MDFAYKSVTSPASKPMSLDSELPMAEDTRLLSPIPGDAIRKPEGAKVFSLIE